MEWCTNDWCYVAADNTCGTGVYDTFFFKDDEEWAGKLKFSTKACIPTPDPEPVAEGSSALYASLIAFSAAALAASI